LPGHSVEAPKRSWLVTGSSTGLGRALCERLLETGEAVACSVRDTKSVEDLVRRYPDQAIAVALDVTLPRSIERAVDTVLERMGRVDVLVNNAGYGVVGALEEFDEAEVRRVFDANVLGVYRVTRALLPHLRERGSGHILNVSSMGGLVAGAGFGMYNATKFAIEGMSEALAQEVAPFGIKVTIVEPGPFRTDFRNRSLYSAPLEAYASTVGKFRQMLADGDGRQPGDPRKAADAMMAAVQAIRKKMAAQSAEIERWLDVSLATSFETTGQG
jgi:NAD(P)-dependent dehydrogenase (short-subunit alcohol dehydrogenase family)